MKLRPSFLLLPFTLALVACGRSPATPAAVASLAVQAPGDEATPEQRTEIRNMVAKIEAYTGELGRPRSFQELPIVVTTDQRTFTDHLAACVSADGKGRFILVKPAVFTVEAGLRAGGEQSTLFRVLLHEIGHCYFHREHEEARLALPPGSLFELGAPRGARRLRLDRLDISVMVPDNLEVPIALEKYYVAELLGLTRARTTEDLAPFSAVSLERGADGADR